MTGPESDAPGLARPELVRVLESAARLQEVVPDAVFGWRLCRGAGG